MAFAEFQLCFFEKPVGWGEAACASSIHVVHECSKFRLEFIEATERSNTPRLAEPILQSFELLSMFPQHI
jgi:hypothetical protein